MDDHRIAPTRTASVEQRIDAVQTVMEARGMEPGSAIDQARHLADEEWVPRNGARIVAKAWTNPAYRQRLLVDGKAAAAELGFGMLPHHRYLMALENMPHL